MIYTPDPYQVRMEQFALKNPCCALWLDMGLGKTVITLSIIEWYVRLGMGPVLVIAPLRVVETTWPEEIHKWNHTRHLKVAELHGPRSARQKALKVKADVYLTNRENTVWLVRAVRKRWPWPTVVLDESSSFKNPSAQRFRALRHMRPYYQRMIQLSGTPAPNGLMDLWTQIYLLDGGERLGATVTEYRQRYFDRDYAGFGYVLKPWAADAIHDKIKDITVSLSAKDYLDLPDIVESEITVRLPRAAQTVYQKAQDEFVLELQKEIIEIASAGVLVNKCLQITNGALYHSETPTWDVLHDAKLDALEEILDNVGGPVLVGYNFKSDAIRIQDRFPHARELKKSLPETMRAWNRGELPLVIAHPASSGMGLNLQHGGHILVWFGCNWSLELVRQFNARLHRRGQTKPVFIYYLIAKGTVDDDVMKAVAHKDWTQKQLLNAVKERLTR